MPPKKKDYTEADLRRQAMAAKHLLGDLQGDGEEIEGNLRHDTIEGETNFFETVEIALQRILDYAVVSDGCAAAIERLQKRKERAEKSAERMRGAIDQAFQIAELETGHDFGIATVSPKKIPPKLLVIEESEIPSRFFKEPEPPAPKLDRKALLDALKERQKALESSADGKDVPPAIPGAELSNGGQTVQIRWA